MRKVQNFKSETVTLFLSIKIYKTGPFQDIFGKLIKSKWQGVIRNIVLIVISVEAATELGNKKIHK